MFKSYFQLGIEHILDPNGLDHVLFIIVLAVPFLIKDWKKVVILATAFTIGHSLTLALSSLDVIKVNASMIEMLIAISIFLTAAYNIIFIRKEQITYRYSIACIFGLIHGMGFSNFFKSILGKDDILLPLLAFNLGVEAAQVIIVMGILLLAYIIVELLKLPQRIWISGLSGIVIILSIQMILERI